MAEVMHHIPDDLKGMELEELAEQHIGRFLEKTPDWDAFADARVEGYKRAQHRFVGAGGSGKTGDASIIPGRAFTLSIMYVEPGQGNAAHTHEVEEAFFVLDGTLNVFFEDDEGKRISRRLGPWDIAVCPPGIIHGYTNDSLERVYFQVMLGRGNPELMGYVDKDLLDQRDAHLSG